MCSSPSCLTGVESRAACVSHRCSQTKLPPLPGKTGVGGGERKKKQKTGPGSSEAHAVASTPGKRRQRHRGTDSGERLIHKPLHPGMPPPLQRPHLHPHPLASHIRRMRLTFTQLSTLQRPEIYSASGRGWSQAST